MMASVEIKDLEVKTDERGWLSEILRQEDVGNGAFGQFFITTAHPGVIKANHYHRRKTEWFCVIKGKSLLVLKDRDSSEKMEIMLGDGNLKTVKIPPNVAHGIKNVGNDMMYLLAYTSEVFNPKDPDTFVEKVI